MAKAALPTIARRGAAGGIDVLHQIRGGGLPGGHESGKHGRGQAEHRGEFQYHAIDFDRSQSRRLQDRESCKVMHRCKGQQKAQCAAHQGQEKRLHQQLAHDPPAACAQSDADCDLLAARGGSSQKQVGNIRASHEQDKTHCGDKDKHHQEDPGNRQSLVKVLGEGAPSPVRFGRFLRDSRRERPHFLPGLGSSDARLRPPYHKQVTSLPVDAPPWKLKASRHPSGQRTRNQRAPRRPRCTSRH